MDNNMLPAAQAQSMDEKLDRLDQLQELIDLHTLTLKQHTREIQSLKRAN